MLTPEANGKPGDLVPDAQASLRALLEFKDMRCEQWYMRVTAVGQSSGWELLTSNSTTNNAIIMARLADSKRPVDDLILAYLGLLEWRGKEQLMAYMQFFRRGYPTGLLFGSHLRDELPSQRPQAYGGFLILGGCENSWI